jgi:hypothetical protein
MKKEKLRNVWCEIGARNAIARLLCPHCVVGRTLLDTHGAKIGPISFFFPALLEQPGRLLLLLLVRATIQSGKARFTRLNEDTQLLLQHT